MPSPSIYSLSLAPSFFGHREISTERIDRIKNAATDADKKEALDMGLWDIFKDLFCENKKADFLEKLWELNHATEFSSKAKKFEEIEKMVDYGDGVEFEIGLKKSGNGTANEYFTTFNVKIDGNPVELGEYKLTKDFKIAELYDVKLGDRSISLGINWLECALDLGIAIEKADFRELNLSGLDIRGKRLVGTSLKGCDLRGAQFDDQTVCELLDLTGTKICEQLFNQIKNSTLSNDAIVYTEDQYKQWLQVRELYHGDVKDRADDVFYRYSNQKLTAAERTLAFHELQSLNAGTANSQNSNTGTTNTEMESTGRIIVEKLIHKTAAFFESKHSKQVQTALTNFIDSTKTASERLDSFNNLRHLAKVSAKQNFIYRVLDADNVITSIEFNGESFPIELNLMEISYVQALKDAVTTNKGVRVDQFTKDFVRDPYILTFKGASTEFSNKDKIPLEKKTEIAEKFLADLKNDYQRMAVISILTQEVFATILTYFMFQNSGPKCIPSSSGAEFDFELTDQNLTNNFLCEVRFCSKKFDLKDDAPLFESAFSMGATEVYGHYDLVANFVIGESATICTNLNVVGINHVKTDMEGKYQFVTVNK